MSKLELVLIYPSGQRYRYVGFTREELEVILNTALAHGIRWEVHDNGY